MLVADEDHDRQLLLAGGLEQARQLGGVQRLGPLAAGQAQRLGTLDLVLLQQGEEVVGVLQRGPAFLQAGGVDLLVRARGLLRLGGTQVEIGGLFFGTEALDQRRPGFFLAAVGEEHLVHGGALGVEDLDAALGAALAFLGDGEHAAPAGEEQAQVDVRGHHQADLPARGDGHVAVRALALVHAVLVAGQRHDRAQLAEGRQQRAPFRAQAHGVHPEAAGDQFGLAHLQAQRGVAGAQVRLLGAQGLPGTIKLGSVRLGRGIHHGSFLVSFSGVPVAAMAAWTHFAISDA
ncbi:hypothetical protein D3C76_792070 [compost metagenome]